MMIIQTYCFVNSHSCKRGRRLCSIGACLCVLQTAFRSTAAKAAQACFETLVSVHDSVLFGEGSLPRMERGFPFASLARIIPSTAHVSQQLLLKSFRSVEML